MKINKIMDKIIMFKNKKLNKQNKNNMFMNINYKNKLMR